MSELTQKINGLAEYEIGLDDIQRIRQNPRSVAGYNLIFKLGTLTFQGIALGAAAEEIYSGKIKQAAATLGFIAAVEGIKYAEHRINLFIDGYKSQRT